MPQYTLLLISMAICFFLSDCRHVPPSSTGTNTNAQRAKSLPPYAYQLQRPLTYAKVKQSDLGDFVVDEDDFFELNKRQTSDDYGHLRFGKRDEFDDYGHMRFGRNNGASEARN